MLFLLKIYHEVFPLFSKAATKTFETGQYDRISFKWRGSHVVQEAKSWSVLSHGQVAFNYMLLIGMIGYSLVILILECIYFYVPAEKEDAVSNF